MSRSGGNDCGDNWEDTREFRRIPYAVPIYEKDDLEKNGVLRDITEKGVGVRGLKVTAGQKRTFVIAPPDFLDIDPLVFEAKCCWVKQEGKGQYVSGFEITTISNSTLRELRKLIGFLTDSE